MLSKQRCPHTGIVNYFTESDPFVSIASIVESSGKSPKYQWRWYAAAQTISGIAADMRTAEQRLSSHYRHYRKTIDADQTSH